MILVDTSVWIDLLNGVRSPQTEFLKKLIDNEKEDIGITEIIFTEILQGIKCESDFRKVKSLLLEFTLFKPKGIATYLKAVQIYRDCRKKGRTARKTVDCIIAAICIENGAALLHNDADFHRIEECSQLKCVKV